MRASGDDATAGGGRTTVDAVMPTVHRFAAALAFFVLATLSGVSATGAQSNGLRELADGAELNFGAAVTVESLADAAHAQLAIDNVNMISTVNEVDFAVVQPQPGVYDFTQADVVVDFAAEHGLTVRGHGLISRSGLPEWIVNGAWTPETLAEVLADHVTTVVSRYAERNSGVVTQWDVVDETFLPDGTLRDSIWRQVIGDDFIRIAFDAARTADPDALLFYDDFYDDLSVTQDAVESGIAVVAGATADTSACADVAKCVGVRDTIGALLAAGAPIDGIGIQAHMLSPDPLDFTTFSGWVDDLALRWAITEFDVPVPVTEIANPDTLAFQSSTYTAALDSCLESPTCDTFVTWGITDRVPPLPGDGAFGGALWYDQLDAPKPAVEAMRAILASSAQVATTTPTTTATSASAETTASPDLSADGTNTGSGAVFGVAVAAVAAFVVVIVAVRRRRTGD